jgi:hypothetical protein
MLADYVRELYMPAAREAAELLATK